MNIKALLTTLYLAATTTAGVMADASQSVELQGTEVIHIENGAVRAFMADSTYYRDSSYETSVIANYNNISYGLNRDLPDGKTASWTPTVGRKQIKELRITVSHHADLSDSITFIPTTVDLDAYTIRNLLPDTIYHYKVEEYLRNGTINTVDSGCFRTRGQVRMIRVAGASNVRDMGGWQTQFGMPIRYGRIYRSGNLDGITSAGIHDLTINLGVNAELDLRGDSPITSSPLGEGFDYVMYDNSGYYEGVVNQYKAYAADLKWVVARLSEGKNVIWHCQIGCDRCGTFSFLVGGLLGMNEIDLCRDYELSTLAGYQRPRYYTDKTYGAFSQLLPYIRTFGPQDDLARCFYNYWLSIGVDVADLEYLRTVLLEGYVPAEETGIQHTTSDVGPTSIFNLKGQRLPASQRGMNIVICPDGTIRKHFVP